jgi:hypothetical protein
MEAIRAYGFRRRLAKLARSRAVLLGGYAMDLCGR